MPQTTKTKYRLLNLSAINRSNRLIFTIYSSGIFACLLLLPKDILDGNYYSCLSDIFVIIGLLVALHIYIERKMFFYGNLLAVGTTCVGILIATYVEGIRSGTFIFFMPLMFAIPFVISRHRNYKELVYIFYPTTAFFFILALIISPEYSTVQDIPIEKAYSAMILNASLSFFLIIVCSITFLLVEKKYIDALIRRKKIAVEERNARTRVLSNLGHELRTQINSINGTTQLILEEASSSESNGKNGFFKYTKTLNYCNNQMLTLVNDILDLHKIEIGKLELSPTKSNLYDIITHVTLPFENKQKKLNGITISKNIAPELQNKWVLLDDSRLIQVIHNLLSNALKFTRQGEVQFTARCVEESDTEIKVYFSVKDTGIGIPKEHQENIFKSFVQINSADYKPLYSGTGLGLSISQSIIEKMGGIIKLESEINNGSNFFFTLSFAKVALQKNTSTKPAPTVNNGVFLKNKTILIAEDNPISMLYTQKLLEKYEATLLKAVNGLEAVTIVEEARHLDLVLLDLEMPVMTGFAAIEKIKKINPSVKVIAFTANIPEPVLINRLKNLGFDDIISKPFKKEDILASLQASLSKHDKQPFSTKQLERKRSSKKVGKKIPVIQ